MKKFTSYCFLFFFIFSIYGYSQRNPETLISNYIKTNTKTLGLSNSDASNFKISSIGTLSNPNIKIAYLQQEISGVPVMNTFATVIIKNNQIQSFKHSFINNIERYVNVQSPSIKASQAAQRAISKLGLNNNNNVRIVDHNTKKDILISELSSINFSPLMNYIKTKNRDYVLTYEIIIKESSHWWVTQVNTNTGEIEHKADALISCDFETPKATDEKPSNHNHHPHRYRGVKTVKPIKLQEIKSSAYYSNEAASYNAFPLRVEAPNHGDRITISNPSVISTVGTNVVPSPYGWHDLDDTNTIGNESTNTTGNNVFAYEDTGDRNAPLPDGSSFAEATSGTAETGLDFDYPLDLTQQPDAYQKAAIVNLFVWNNYMHDISYAYGFDETNGNFQEGDYDRFDGTGAVLNDWDSDYVQAEAQDGDGINNANFGTLADGFNPTMQMYLWGSSPFGEFIIIEEPTDSDELLGTYASARFPFQPIPRSEDPIIKADLVLVQDDGLPYTATEDGGTAGASPNPSDGCTDYTAESLAAVSGKIAVIRRGVCTFVKKITQAQNAGAIAAIIVNNVANDGPVNGGGEPYEEITIPAISLSYEDGEALIAKLGDADGDGTIEATPELISGHLIDNGPEANLIGRDGDLDQGIIAHEYAHGISTRLVGGRTNFSCLLSQTYQEQMGEGWSDFFALITTQKTTDTNTQGRGIGTYVQFQGTDGAGIRPSPYSTDFSINDYTYADVADESLSVPHGIGFVWATMLWDMYWAFIDEYGFDPDMYYGSGGNNKAIQLVMDGLKLIPCGNVGFVTGRDAIIEADANINDGANECLIRRVFARRGVGALAVQGTSESRSDQVEDCSVKPVASTITCDELTEAESPCTTLAVEHLNGKTIFGIYPNPAKTAVYITTNKNIGNAYLKLFDINGRIIINETIDLGKSPSINVTNLQTGIYIVKIKTETGEEYTQKLIKN